MSRRADQVLHDPTALVALLVAGQIVAWTLAPALTHYAPPLDVVESTMWGREWVIATYKHPALPSWALEASRLLTGAVGWPAYLVSQLFVAATFVFAFLLGRDLMDPRRAAAGTLLLTGIAFYAWPTPEFNHNVAETPFWAALPWALWRAVERRGIGWWALVGALAAGGLYAKLTTALLLVTLAAWILWDARARRCLTTPGPWLGLAIFVALAAPLAFWLVAHDFAPLKYAAARSTQVREGGGGGVPVFLINVALNLAGMLAMLAIAGLIGPRRCRDLSDAAAEPPPPPVAPRALRYLIVLTAGPLVLAIVAALIAGANVKSAWGSSMFNLAGILAVALTSQRFDFTALRRIAICGCGCHRRRAGRLRPRRRLRPVARRGAVARELAAGRDLQALRCHLGARDRTAAAHRQRRQLGGRPRRHHGQGPAVDPQQRRSRALPLDHARAAGAGRHAHRLGGELQADTAGPAAAGRRPACRGGEVQVAAIEGPRRSGHRLRYRAAEMIPHLPSTPPRP